jgi:uncharacterized membrane protein
MFDLGAVAPFTDSIGLAINNAGVIVGNSGSQAFRYEGGVMTAMTPFGAYRNDAMGINNLGWAVGISWQSLNSCQLAVKWDPSGGVTELSAPTGLVGGSAYDINDYGAAVGFAGCGPLHAALWDAQGIAVDLNSVLIDGEGWMLNVALSINNRGQIVGSGHRDGYGTRAFLLTPVPIPNALWLFGSALGVMGWMRRREAV